MIVKDKVLGRAAFKLRDAFHYLLDGEVEFLQELAASLPLEALIINIGAGPGTSCLAFLEARSSIYVVTIDIVAEPSPCGSLGSEEIALREAGLWELGRNRQIHGDSKLIGKDWTEPVDMVFVDGDHSYEGCRGDIEAWAPHVKLNGIMAMHDYQSDWWGDVIRATEDTLGADPAWEKLNRVTTTIAFRRIAL